MRTACKVSNTHSPPPFLPKPPLSIADYPKWPFITQYTREVLDLAAAAVKPGVTGDEIDRIVHEASFGTFCCSMFSWF